MNYKQISIEEFLKDFKASLPNEQTISDFESKLKILLENAYKKDSEEYQKNEITKFLNKVFDYDCNVKGNIDSVIYEYGEARVIFEVKSINNKAEFVKYNSNNLESKAFYESILYFLREIKSGNNNITFVILATAKIFYIIDAKSYLNNFNKNKEIQKAFKNCVAKGGTDTSTTKFYGEVSNILPKIEGEIPYLCVNFKDIINSNKLGLLYILLSPQVLLKRTTYIDANTLNVKFYDELLYILGLKESGENRKIEYSETENTFLDAISKAFKFNKDNDFEDIFSLLITWNNRILFLRLLESMLLSFKHIEEPFLDLAYVPNFDKLNILFFEVLAKKEDERNNIPEKLDIIPYLNSSLFEKKELEKQGKEIRFLQSNNLKIYQHSILRSDKNLNNKYLKNNKTESLPLLEYLFAFLHAYDFTTTSQDLQNNIKVNYDMLINSAVLGLVFEKLNGYKDGSFYTPSFITNYMCSQSLDKVVVEKFNISLDWKCKTIDDIRISLDRFITNKESLNTANRIFNEIRICDPAVGSGHFLVSALNELLLIKHNLGLLADEDGKKLKDISLELKNDEIVIKNSENNIHSYMLPKNENVEMHKIQRTIFFAKKEIIENNLFGVDINYNSCEITKLRMWIELLKYSYYKDIKNKRLETLPNIDINIKCGNSLISRFDLSDSLAIVKNISDKIKNYKNSVSKYKEGKANKQDLKKEINDIKRTFTLTLKDKKTYDKLQKEVEKHIVIYGNFLLDKSLLDGLELPKTENLFNDDIIASLSYTQRAEAGASIGNILVLKNKLNSIKSGEAYKNAFEWRFEFPEVLDNEGNFKGFDLVIGNPPYGVELTSSERELYKKYYKTSQTNTASLFILLSDKILAKNGINMLIVPKSLIYVAKWEQVRSLIDPTLYLLADCSKAWDDVLLEMVIFGRCKNKVCQSYKNLFLEESKTSEVKPLLIDKSFIKLFGLFINGIGQEELNLGIKLTKNNEKLEKFCKNIRGASAQSYLKEKGKYAYIGGKQINRYGIIDIKGFHNKKEKSAEILNNALLSQDIVAHITKPRNHIKIIACIPKNKDIYILNTINQLVFENVDIYLAWAIINSKLINWYVYKFIFSNSIRTMHLNSFATDKIPIPKITSKNKKLTDEIINNVDKILTLKSKNADTNDLEAKIDSLIYELYNLTEDEIKIIER